MSFSTISYPSPFGPLFLTADHLGLCSLNLQEGLSSGSSDILSSACLWLDAYFAKRELPPLPPLHLKGTAFQKRVWQLLLDIPYGSTTTYGTLARQISPTMSAQAIGQAVHRNPIPILIPCHRVIGAHDWGGYAYGLEMKKQLLDWESRNI